MINGKQQASTTKQITLLETLSDPRPRSINKRPSKRAESVRTMQSLRKIADKIAKQFNLKYKELRAQRSDVYSHYGVCYEDGSIEIRLRHAKTGELLRTSSLVNTLCHEMAHLRYFDHGDGFKRLYASILRWAKAEGIYQPRTVQATKLKTHHQPKAPLPAVTKAPDTTTVQLKLFS